MDNKKGKDLEKEKDYKAKKMSVMVVIVFFIIAIIFTICLLIIRTEATKPGVVFNSYNNHYDSEYQIDNNSLSDFDLFFLKTEVNSENKIYSPLSLKYALGMLYEASAGDSRGQLEAIIGDYKFNKFNNSKNISFANAVFIRDSFLKNVRNSYITKVKDKYNAEVKSDSFENANGMNKWVSDNTFGLINNIFKDDDVNKENFELVNSLAIDMEWNKKIQATPATSKNLHNPRYKHENYSHYIPLLGSTSQTIKFNEKDVDVLELGADANKYDIIKDLGEDNIKSILSTEYKKYVEAGNICDSDKDEDKVIEKFINDLKSNYNRLDYSTDFYFLDNDDVKVFAKDLKKYDGRTLQYVGIMPKNIDLNQFIHDTSSRDIKNIISNMKDLSSNSFKDGVITRIEGKIPVFNYDYQLSLINDLKKMGVTDVFSSSKANLDGMLKVKDNYITSAAHKANIDFSNDGIKAAASTAFGGAGSATGCFEYLFDVPVEVIDLTFDKPYMYLIRDKETNEAWFIGAVYNIG